MIRIGLIGAGGMGNVHARHYRNMPDVEIKVLERDPERLEAFQRRWDAPSLPSMEALLNEVDAVDICLPTDLHSAVAKQAMAAKRAVFVEKPLAGSFAEAIELHEISVSAGTVLMVGHVVRYFPEFEKGNRLVREGAVGTPAVARTRRGGLAPTGSDSWFMDHSRSGGVLLDLAIHDFDWLRWTIGEVESVYAQSLGAKTGQGPDYGLTLLSFENGAIAHVESTWMDPGGFRTSYEVAGSGGLIEFDSRDAQTLRSNLPGKTFNEGPLAVSDDPYFKQLSAFVRSAQTGEKPPVTGLDGAMSVGIAHAAIQSARERRPIQPPKP